MSRLQLSTQVVQEPRDPGLFLDIGDRKAIDTGGPGSGVAGNPVERHDQRRRVIDEVEQVIKPAALISRRPTVKLGLHLRYPPERAHDPRGRSVAVQRRIWRHCSLLPFSEPLPPFAMWPAFPAPDYYGGSASPRPFSGRCAYPGTRAGRAPPGTATRWIPCSLLSACRRRSPALPQ